MPLEICRDLVSPSFPLAHVQSGEKRRVMILGQPPYRALIAVGLWQGEGETDQRRGGPTQTTTVHPTQFVRWSSGRKKGGEEERKEDGWGGEKRVGYPD